MRNMVPGKEFVSQPEFINDPSFLLWVGHYVTQMDLTAAAVSLINRELVRSDSTTNVAVGFFRAGDNSMEVLAVNPRLVVAAKSCWASMEHEHVRLMALDYHFRRQVANELRRAAASVWEQGCIPKKLDLGIGCHFMIGVPPGAREVVAK